MTTAQEASPQRREDTTAGVDVSHPGSHQSTSTEEAVHDINVDSVTGVIVLDIDKIIADDTVRTRAAVNEEIVKEYADQMGPRSTFPPVTVFSDGASYWLGDGFHRVEAAKSLRHAYIEAEVRDGTRLDAITFGFKANDHHGLRRTNADKEYAVTMALREFKGRSDRAIADLCGVGHQLVARVRQLDDSSSSSRTGLDGKTRKVKPKAAKPTSKKEPVSMSKPQAAPSEEPQDMPGDQEGSSPLVVGAEAPTSPVQPEEQKVISAPVTCRDVVEGECVASISGDDGVPTTPQVTMENTIPAGGEGVEFVLADGSRRRVPWFQNRLTFRDVDDHIQWQKAHYESKDAFPKYDQPTLVKFQNALISAASLAVSILGNNPTPTDLEIAHQALKDIFGMLPNLPRT